MHLQLQLQRVPATVGVSSFHTSVTKKLSNDGGVYDVIGNYFEKEKMLCIQIKEGKKQEYYV